MKSLRSLGAARKFELREEIEFIWFLCLRPPNNVVFAQVLKKSALRMQNLLFFAITVARLRRCSQDLSGA